jgi:hypothetical protein
MNGGINKRQSANAPAKRQQGWHGGDLKGTELGKTFTHTPTPERNLCVCVKNMYHSI